MEILCCVMFPSVQVDWRTDSMCLVSGWDILVVMLTFPIDPFYWDFQVDCKLCLKLGLLVLSLLIRALCVNGRVDLRLPSGSQLSHCRLQISFLGQ